MHYHEVQHRLWTSPARFNVYEAPRRVGKSKIAKMKGVCSWSTAILDTGLHDWFGMACAPTRDQAKAIYWEPFKAAVPESLVAKIRETDLTIQHVDGPMLAVVGMDKPARAEGRPIDLALVDEFADMKQGVWERHIRPALDTPGRPGRAWIYGVPRPSAQFQKLSDFAKSGLDPEWAYFFWNAEGILAPEVIDAARRELDEKTFAQEYGGQRVAQSGLAYYTFERAAHVKDDVRYDADAPLLFGLDFNVAPGSAVVAQDYEGMTRFIGEVRIPNDSNTPLVCRKLVADWADKHRGPVHYYGDPTGGNRGTAKLDGSDWDIVAKELRDKFRGGVSDRVERRVKPERARINAINARMRNAAGEVHVEIDRARCPWLIRDAENMLVKEGSDGALWKERDLTLGHWMDGAGYIVLALHPLNEHVLFQGTL